MYNNADMEMLCTYYESIGGRVPDDSMFHDARRQVAEFLPNAINIKAETFYLVYTKWMGGGVSTPTSHDNGDFDDMGRGAYSAAYHHAQKWKHGRF